MAAYASGGDRMRVVIADDVMLVRSPPTPPPFAVIDVAA
jgi:hypothetical protein